MYVLLFIGWVLFIPFCSCVAGGRAGWAGLFLPHS